MTRKFTLEDFKAESEKRFGSLEINGITFRPVLRLSDEEREEFSAKSEELDQLHKQAAAHQEAQTIAAENKSRDEADQVEVPVTREVKPAEIRKVTVELLRVTTKNTAEFDEWSKTLDEADIYTILGMYSEDAQVGEA